MASESTPAAPGGERVRLEMLDEDRRLVDAARSAGLTLRLLGGLAVREHCRTAQRCERDHSHLDMVARAKQARGLLTLFAGFGYTENYAVSTATANAELPFVRPRVHGGVSGAGPAHADDHVEIFLDAFRMDRDIVTLLGDAEVGEEDARGLINGRYIGQLCADDWGLFYDVATNLTHVDEGAGTFDLSDLRVARVHKRVVRLIAAIDGAPKSVRWRLRARVGTRKTWHNQIDAQE